MSSTTPLVPIVATASTTPPAADPAAVVPVIPPVRPGDLILIRAIKWWDSGQIQRAVVGILAAAAPVLVDLYQKNTLTWHSGVFGLVFGLFIWMGWSRVKAPDIITGTKAFDKAPVAVIPPHLVADIAAANVPKTP